MGLIRDWEAELKAAHRRIARLEKDTARLDWLEGCHGVAAGCITNVGNGDEWYWRVEDPGMPRGWHGDTLRRALDAAREAENQPPKSTQYDRTPKST